MSNRSNFETESSKMKVAPFVLALVGFTSAEKCAASRGPRPDFESDVTVAPPVTVTEGWRQLTTEAYGKLIRSNNYKSINLLQSIPILKAKASQMMTVFAVLKTTKTQV